MFVRATISTCMLVLSVSALEAQHFVRYTQARTWNEARQVCQNEGTELASINRFSTAYLVKAVAETPVYNVDNIWVGLHDVAQDSTHLGAEGYRWSTCRALGSWTNWADQEPTARWSNWCIRLVYIDSLTWYPEQCASLGHYLCMINLGECTSFRSADGCDVGETNLTSSSHWAITEEVCRTSCVTYYLDHRAEQVQCWMYRYFVANETCVLYEGSEPLFCRTAPTTPTTGSLVVRDCYSVSYNDSVVSGVQQSWDANPAVDCPAHTTQPVQTTEMASDSGSDPTTQLSNSPPTSPVTPNETNSTSAFTSSSASRTSSSVPLTSLSSTTASFSSSSASSSSTTASPSSFSASSSNSTTSSSSSSTSNTATSSSSSSKSSSNTTTSSSPPLMSAMTTTSPSAPAVTSSDTTVSSTRLNLPKPTSSTSPLTSLSSKATSSEPPLTSSSTQTTSSLLSSTSSSAQTTSVMTATALSGVIEAMGPDPSASSAGLCGCFCLQRIRVNVTEERMREIRNRLQSQLMLNKSELSSARRKKESAPDHRPSAQASGAVGALVLVMVMVVVVVPDVGSVIRAILHRCSAG